MKSILLAFIFLICTASPALAWQLKGTVHDAEGEPVAYASVYLQNTTTGVLTNIKGEFFMELANGKYTLVVNSMGFSTHIREVAIADANQVIDITLEPAAVDIDTVVVTASRRDPAYDIMEKVIAAKKEHAHPFSSYTRDTYLKAALEVEEIKKVTLDSTLADTIPADTSAWAAWADSLAADSLAPRRIQPEPEPDTLVNTRTGVKDGPSYGARIWRTGFKDGPGTLHPDSTGSGKRKEGRQRLYLIESVSTTYFQDPGQFKSVVHGYLDFSEKVSPESVMSMGEDGINLGNYQTVTNNPYLFYLDPTDAQFNFYDNLIPVLRLSDQPFISPLSSTAWRTTYKYRLVESFMQDGRVIHRIEVKPRNDQGPVFEGEIFIVEGMWAIQSLNLQIKRGALIYFRDFRMIHEYSLTPDMRWTLKREEYYYNVKDGKELYYGNTTAVHKDYQLDVTHPKGFFRNELRRVEKEAFERDSTYWAANRPITLKAAEIAFIREQDSIRAYHQSPEYLREIDSTYNRLSVWDVLLSGVGYRSRKHRLEFHVMPLIAQMQWYGVGGYRHMLGGDISKSFSRYHQLSLEGEMDYGFANQDLKGYAKLGFMYDPRRQARFFLKGGDRYALVTSTTSIVGLLGRNNYVRKTYFGAGHSYEALNGLYLDTEFEFADRRAIDGLTFDNDVFGGIDDPLAFQLYREFLVTIRLRWIPFQKYNSEPYRKVVLGSNWPTFELTYKKGIPGIWGSEINFDKVELRVTDEFRPGTFGVGRWAAVAGSYIQEANLRFNDYKFFRGSTPYLFTNPLEDFQNLDTTYSTTGTYLQANYVHDDAGSIISKIPILRRTPLQITGGAAALLVPERDLFHAEVFGGLAMPFRIKQQRFKLGAFYSTSYSNTGNAISGQWKFGITFYDSWLRRWNW